MGKKAFFLTGFNEKSILERKYNFQNQMDGLNFDDCVSQDGTIDYKKLRDRICPIIKDIDFFISFSSLDKKIVDDVVYFLKNKGMKVFVDYIFWNYVEDFIKEYCEKRGKDGQILYDDHKKADIAFHCLLIDSLRKVIKEAKNYIFIGTENSCRNSETLSPWIYLENDFCNDQDLEKFDNIVHESFANDLKISYPLNLNDFRYISYRQFKAEFDIIFKDLKLEKTINHFLDNNGQKKICDFIKKEGK